MLSLLMITRQNSGTFRAGSEFVVSFLWELSDIETHLRLKRTDAILIESTFPDTDQLLTLSGASRCPVFFYDRWKNTLASPENEMISVQGLIHRWRPEVWSTLAAWTRRPRPEANCTPAPWRDLIVGESKAILEVIRVIQMVARRNSTVLITGETGTGKECAAKAIHLASDRASRPMLAVNCASLPDSLLEAELFGHTKGAFTGAVNARAGYFEQANNGTLFFDEIGDISASTQVKLLRVLQEREIIRIGSSEKVPVNIRLICATNRNLGEAVRKESFRQDLYYRLNVLPLRVPPLRERLEDLPVLVEHFIEKICRREDLGVRSVAPDVFPRLAEYPWPGNVRELENAVEMAVAMSGDRTLLHASDFNLWNGATPSVTPEPDLPENGLHYESFISNLQRSLIEQAIRRARGNQTMAANLLGMKRTTLISKCKALGSCA